MYKLYFAIFCFFLAVTFSLSAQKKEYKTVNIFEKSIYPETDYDEILRNQFHFSSKTGWINDVNGPVYYEGKYFLFFQHYPFGNQWDTMHWGCATSTDLVHWKQHNPAIVPGLNANGMAYSGTAVVDIDNTSGLKKGKHAPIVLVYTDINEGQSLVYSADGGASWERYSGNPVLGVDINDKKKEDRRDPKVFWHQPTKKWIMVVFHAKIGMEFFSSKNLISWQYHSTFKGDRMWECPDMFEMVVEGCDQKKWILMAASGNYYIGDFDGKTFTPESGSQVMYRGPSHYAAQSFYNMPNGRFIQMGWMGNWNKEQPLPSLPWNHSITLPCELKLYAVTNGFHIRRTPIKELNKLVSKEWKYTNLTFTKENNPIAKHKEELFAVNLIINMEKSLSDSIQFIIGSKVITYYKNENRINQEGGAFSDKGNLHIRIYKDRASYELFMLSGTNSLVEEYPFGLDKYPLEISADKPVYVNQLTFQRLKSIW